jgi:NADPH:quinone reductase-like Zn-dependent oxidoreductase
MKAIRIHRQGGPEQLVYEEAPKPELGVGDALIRVHATGITPAELTWAETYRNCDGSERPPSIPGHEVSKVVESVADGVGDVSIGDEVYALTSFCRDGSAAEYVAVLAADLTGIRSSKIGSPVHLSASSAAVRFRSSIGKPSSRMNPADRYSGRAPLIARSFTVP